MNVTIDDLTILFGVLGGLLVFMLIVYSVLRAVQNSKDDNEPVETSKAKVVDKPQTGNEIVITAPVTFELEDGRRVRLSVRGEAFMNLLVGDSGELTWQGSRYIDFKRGL